MNLLSLFSGCGGMDIGFDGSFCCFKKSVKPEWINEDYGDIVLVKPTFFNIVFADDIRPDAKTAWCSYFSKKLPDTDSLYHLESIVDIVKKAKEGHYRFPEDIDVITGGFPCQDFSIAGKRLGFNSRKSHLGTLLETDEPSEESRGKLYMWMRDVITLTSPKLFVAENVKGLTNLSDTKEIIEHDFADAGDGGYLVVPAKVLNAYDFGVPQNRERVIFFGFRKSALKPEALGILSESLIPDKYQPYPERTHGEGLLPYVNSADVLKGLMEPEESPDISQRKYSKAKYYGRHCQGHTEIRLDGPAPTIRSEHHGNIEYRRLSREHGGIHYEELNNGLRERRLSVRECARIQTFPDNYEFVQKGVSSSDAYKLIGNAVPPVLAYNIAMNIQEKWDKYFN